MSSGDDHFIRPDNDIDITERLSFDADRCEISYSTGVAKNIREGIDTIERLRARLEGMSKELNRAAEENAFLRLSLMEAREDRDRAVAGAERFTKDMGS